MQPAAFLFSLAVSALTKSRTMTIKIGPDPEVNNAHAQLG